MRSTVIIGPPGSGKTMLMRGLRQRLAVDFADRQRLTYGLLAAEWWPDPEILLPGFWYDRDPCPGTDLLEPEAADWLDLVIQHRRHLAFDRTTIVMDGHRLLSPALLTTLRNQTDHHLIELTARGMIRRDRLAERPGGPMNDAYLTQLEVRYAYLSATYQPDKCWINETEADYQRNLARVCALVGIETEVESV